MTKNVKKCPQDVLKISCTRNCDMDNKPTGNVTNITPLVSCGCYQHGDLNKNSVIVGQKNIGSVPNNNTW